MMGLDLHVGDLETRRKLLDFSLTHCPAEEIVSTLQSKKLLQLQVMYLVHSKLMMGHAIDTYVVLVGVHMQVALSLTKSLSKFGGGPPGLLLCSKQMGMIKHYLNKEQL